MRVNMGTLLKYTAITHIRMFNVFDNKLMYSVVDAETNSWHIENGWFVGGIQLGFRK